MAAALTMAIRTAGAFLAIYAFSILMDTPRKYVLRAGIVGAIGGFVYLVSVQAGLGDVASSFLSSFAAALVSHTFARIFKTPVTLFLVAGILPIVPGAGMYRTVHFILARDEAQAVHYLVQTIEIAGVIALAIFVMDTIFRSMLKGEWKQNSMKYVRKTVNLTVKSKETDEAFLTADSTFVPKKNEEDNG